MTSAVKILALFYGLVLLNAFIVIVRKRTKNLFIQQDGLSFHYLC